MSDSTTLRYYGIPTLGLPREKLKVLDDDTLLREIVLRARIEYFAAECAFGEKQMKFPYMAAHYHFTFTREPEHGRERDPNPSLYHLIREVDERAKKGSAACLEFIEAYGAVVQKALNVGLDNPYISHETALHGALFGEKPYPASDVIWSYNSRGPAHQAMMILNGPHRIDRTARAKPTDVIYD